MSVEDLGKWMVTVAMGANWLRRRMDRVWYAPWLVTRPRKNETTQKRERADGSRGLKCRAFPRERR